MRKIINRVLISAVMLCGVTLSYALPEDKNNVDNLITSLYVATACSAILS